MSSLGEKISALRSERGLSIKAMASEAGVGTTTVQRIEHDEGGSYPDTIRKLLAALHRDTALSEADAVAVADASKLSRGAVLEFLRRIRPLIPGDQSRPVDTSVSIDRWRIKCHALVDRMLARAGNPEQVEIALVAMVAAFESSMPETPDTPLLTKRGTPHTSGGVTRQTDEHYQTRDTA